MAFLTHRGAAPAFRYAGQPIHILAGHEDEPAGFAAMQITVPAHFAGPIPHAHDELDEAIYVLSGRLLVAGDDAPQEAVAGSMFVAPRGQRHSFSNPHGTVAWVLGIWAPAGPAAIPPDGLRVQRRAMLARSTTGEPVLWTQRRRELLVTPPTFALRFDVLQPDPPPPLT